ncbi:MAG: CrcB family protein [Firmicutes bacterium]|nr:CrcB family protein [Bacillota bacterium]
MIEWAGVAVGGIFGAWTRFAITNLIGRFWKANYPLATFLINITGAFLLGFVTAAARPNNVFDYWLRSAVGIGFLGAYTTFSTFMFESITLTDRRAFLTMFSYLAASILFGLLGAWLGLSI